MKQTIFRVALVSTLLGNIPDLAKAGGEGQDLFQEQERQKPSMKISLATLPFQRGDELVAEASDDEDPNPPHVAIVELPQQQHVHTNTSSFLSTASYRSPLENSQEGSSAPRSNQELSQFEEEDFHYPNEHQPIGAERCLPPPPSSERSLPSERLRPLNSE